MSVDKLSRDDAMIIMEEWADVLELDTEGDIFRAVSEALLMAVRLGKLSFDEETEEFTYLLSSKVKDKSGEPVEIIKIKSISMEDKKVLEKYSGEDQTIKGAVAMVAKYTGMTTSQVSQLKDRDTMRINAITTGFFMQTIPSEKKR